ncbi:MAG TPA: cupredoxin domain-containing protein [Dehalococcoidia bacterium]|nr:cupredoxin domain-containing protein [Dehalococcoidia bacterium]
MARIALLLALAFIAAMAVACGDDAPSSGPDEIPLEGTVLAVTARDIRFTPTELSAPAGVITIALKNEDGGIPHNIRVHRGNNQSGDTVGRTEIEDGPSEQRLRLELEAGEYYYHCDPHPNMRGSLIVT